MTVRRHRVSGSAAAIGAAPAGIVVVAKPAGPTSHDVVALVRRLSGAKRVGHGGTLDPFASGVLPVFIGSATRMAEYHLHDAKAYRAVACFGATSTTDDIEGELTRTGMPVPTRPDVEATLPAFTGRVVQRPPAFSAVKIAGRRAYEMARRGERPELRDRDVEVQELRLVDWDASEPGSPCATLVVHCSAGTYVRSLARDLGERLGCGAYLASLVRTASGPFRIEDAVDLDEVRRLLAGGQIARRLLPPDAGLDAYPEVALSPGDLQAIARGQVVRLPDADVAPGPDGLVRVIARGRGVVAMAHLRDGRLHPDKVLVGALD
ncbi:MAG TPA: tRNA pseudouridine(55) synthase TruB [Candidatus Acidoferrales bacterium]|nr:tRNA pseudouridine(55) synthase TruB [Candidatus Acidoferrales bacterium]